MPKSGRCESQLWCGGVVVFTDEVKRTSLVIRSQENDPVVDVDPRLKWVVFGSLGIPQEISKKKRLLGLFCPFLETLFMFLFSCVLFWLSCTIVFSVVSSVLS